MIADHEGLQESEVPGIYVKFFTDQEVFANEPHEFPCGTGTLKLPNRSRPSSTVTSC